MSAVTLLRNPAPDVSTHEWHPAGIDQLTRDNKLTSLPFWVHNATMRTHQFKLIILKGLVAAKDPSEDSYGLLLELIPPPDDPSVAGADKMTEGSSNERYPYGCTVTVQVVNHQDNNQSITTSETAVLDATNLQLSFADLISSRVARSSAFLSNDEPAALTIRLCIRTGVNVIAQHLTSTIASLWSSVSKSVTQLVQETEQVYHEVRAEVAQHQQQQQQQQQQCAKVPWDAVPPLWQSRADEWRSFTRDVLFEDERTFLCGPPQEGFSADQKALLLQESLNPTRVANAYSQFDFDRDVHEGLLATPAIRAQRYRLVPARIREETFWANYFWRVACGAMCEQPSQVTALLSVLNAPDSTALPGSLLQKKQQLRESTQVAADSSGGDMPNAIKIESLLKDAEEAAKLLHECVLSYSAEGGGHLLAAVSASTCESYIHQVEPLYTQGTGFSDETVLLLGATLQKLRTVLAEYQRTVAAKPRDTAVENVVPLASPVREGATLADVTETSPGAAETPGKSSSNAAHVVFPKMPWEEEEEEGECTSHK